MRPTIISTMNTFGFALIIGFGFGLSNAKLSPLPFYSSSGGSFLYMSNFSQDTSFRKFRESLTMSNDAEKSVIRLLPTRGAPFEYFGVQYYVSESSYLSNEPHLKWTKKCVLSFNQTTLLNDIYLSDGTTRVETLIWSCAAHGWCCGIECCQPHFKTPWAVIGPDAVAIIFGVLVFIVCLGLMELFARLRALFRRESTIAKPGQLDFPYMPAQDQSKEN